MLRCGLREGSITVMAWKIWGLLLIAALASCSGDLPSGSVAEGQGERAYGLLTPSTALSSLIRDRGLEAPDPSRSEPLLRQLKRELAKSDPTGAYAGITYDLTRGNTLKADWLVQTPNRWGR